MRLVSSGESIQAMMGGRDGRSYSYISDVSLMAEGVKLRMYRETADFIASRRPSGENDGWGYVVRQI